MTKIPQELLNEFEQYKRSKEGKPISEEALRGVVNDDVEEEIRLANLRTNHDRTYNHKPDKVEPRTVAEKD